MGLSHSLMSKAAMAIAFTLAAAPSFAWDLCDELWFTRNQIYDRAGYCFNSNLGRAVFDNTGCTPGEVRLSGAAARDVATIQSYEAEMSCRVDTSRRSINIPGLSQRLSLQDIPVPSPYASACYGFGGAPITLRAGRSANAPVTGSIQPGANLVWTFDGVSDGWNFVQNENPSLGMGWYRDYDVATYNCAQSAG